MISKFSGRCRGCGKAYPDGEDIYWTKEEGGWHWECFENRKPGPEAFAVADQLGFVKHGDPVPEIWFTWGSAAPVRESETPSLFEYN